MVALSFSDSFLWICKPFEIFETLYTDVYWRMRSMIGIIDYRLFYIDARLSFTMQGIITVIGLTIYATCEWNL